jgi:hypothetical protein
MAQIFVLSFFSDHFQMRERMALHYQDREELYEGAVVIFHRGDSISHDEKRIWWGRFKLDGRNGYKTISLKTRNHAEARAKAREEYLRFSQMVKEGASLRNLTFEKAWRSWYETMVAHNVWSDSRKKWHLNYFNRYFGAYFKDKKLDEITDEFANEYFGWRKRYWVDGEGSKSIEYNRRRKGLKTHSTHNAKKVVAYKTLAMEQSALNQFFKVSFNETIHAVCDQDESCRVAKRKA